MTWNNPPIMFLWLKLLLLAHCFRYRYGGGMALISVLWYHRIIMIFPSKWLDPPKPFLHRHIPIMYPSQMAENIYSPINFHIYEGGRYLSVDIWISNTLFRSIYFNVHLIWIEEGGFCSVTPFDQDANTFPYYFMQFVYKHRCYAITHELRFTNTKPSPYVDKFWKLFQRHGMTT